ncbi:MAG TPA: FAD-dependent oxidoreductase [Gammaproteobacteria bacterium]|nr:FAD-dependent oxidoreductase [Gammaproteobacteria bacterium]
MARDPRFDPLFEPLKLGPVTAPNRFYQVPHCTGMGYQRPRMLAALRGLKAEGGWGVVCTEYCSIDNSSDETPYPSASLRDDDDVRNLRLMTDAVHAHGALAGVELWYGGHTSANLLSREPQLDVASLPVEVYLSPPAQSVAMDKADIAAFRELHKSAARRALEAGFDIVYVYACHYYLLHNFLLAEFNQRSDEYGGSLENRVRLLREVIEDVAEIVAGRAALAVRYAAPLPSEDDDPQELVAAFRLLADLPDLWDLASSDYTWEMGSSRFVREAELQQSVARLKALTTKPVVSVGRFTSPDTMLRQITGGTQDFIGAARPSIADPFLPRKIDEGRLEDIRECIGCNVCYAHDSVGTPIRCTQNPTMGEEWRRGWHPERIEARHADESVLVVGAGPAGLEAATALGRRGYDVILAEADEELGGRINNESRLPGLAEYARVRDWRLGQLARMARVQIYPANRLDADAVLELDSRHVILATGATWRRDGIGRHTASAFRGHEHDRVIGLDALFSGNLPRDRVIVYDDDHYYLGSAVALMLSRQGARVTLATPEARVGRWTLYTNEYTPTLRALADAGVEIVSGQRLVAFEPGRAYFESVDAGAGVELEADYLIPVGAREAADELWAALQARRGEFEARGGLSIRRIGDCHAPGIIAAAVYAGHRAARELGQTEIEVKRDRVVV